MLDLVQLVGALFILAAFVAAQFGWLRPTSRRYLIANALGSVVLTATALAGRDWGFVLLEGVWAVVSLTLLARPAPTVTADSGNPYPAR